MANSKKLTYLDIFAGAGGLSEGFLAAGFEPVAHVEMNSNACLTQKTRVCYYYLKNHDRLELYRQYERGEITRDELYKSVPAKLLDTVIEETMSEEGMPELFDKINGLKREQGIKKIDVLAGGPPCQAYSLAGRSRKDMTNDPRNYLFELYVQFLNEYKPEMFVFENVPGLLTAKGSDGCYILEKVKRAFTDAGYDFHPEILKASNYGVLQNRRRVIIVGWKHNTKYQYPDIKKHPVDKYQVRDLLSDLPSLQPGEIGDRYKTKKLSKYLKDTGIRKDGDQLTLDITRSVNQNDREIYKREIEAWNSNKKRIRYNELPERLCTHNNKKEFLDRYKVVAQNESTCQTMVAHISKDGHYYIHPDIQQARSISVREAARIQSFPDDFYFEGGRTSAFLQIGNAVPPLMAKQIAEGIKEELADRGR